MTSLLIHIKHRCPLIWRAVERVNGLLFALRFGPMDDVVREVLGTCCTQDGYRFSSVESDDIPSLSAFLGSLPPQRLEHFNPHAFDVKTLRRLHRNPAFVMMKITHVSDCRLAGYFFLRCFFVGKAFHGLVVAESCAGRGLGTRMWALSSRICARKGLRMFATVSQDNAASLLSARRGTQVRVAEQLADGYLLIECKNREQ